jgi:CRP/FNR family transcriptional regulator, cyclic AMP receptor protein
MAEPRNSAALLRKVPLFASLDDAQLGLLAAHVQRRTYPRGATIISAGEPTQSLHLLVSGRSQVVVSDSKGNMAILAILRPGEYFGEMGLLDDHPRSASVVARETCEILTLAREQFAACLKNHFELCMTVARGLVKRLRYADNRIGSLALLDVYGRVAQLLLQESEIIDGRRIVTGRYSKQDIARMIGASRERVSRVMTDLEQRGFIEVRRSAIELRDPILTLAE